MLTTLKLPKGHRLSRKAYTLVELLAVMFVIAFPAMVAEVVRGKHGHRAAIIAGVLAFPMAVLLVIFFYRLAWKKDKHQLLELREKYRTVYLVKALPTDAKSIVKPEGAEIQVGDYGWDARPNRRDGLIHLQGLTLNWKVVWHAGFHLNQIEKAATKPASQYDYWLPYWAKSPSPPPCPYPVQKRNTPTMGLPHHSGHYFERYPSQDYSSQETV